MNFLRKVQKKLNIGPKQYDYTVISQGNDGVHENSFGGAWIVKSEEAFEKLGLKTLLEQFPLMPKKKNGTQNTQNEANSVPAEPNESLRPDFSKEILIYYGYGEVVERGYKIVPTLVSLDSDGDFYLVSAVKKTFDLRSINPNSTSSKDKPMLPYCLIKLDKPEKMNPNIDEYKMQQVFFDEKIGLGLTF
uniref:Uncharacterized protein n=1 Tax=Percolomonas cosmopolitus TaxID=63605 RepID=A0A7S1KS61_9EUKA